MANNLSSSLFNSTGEIPALELIKPMRLESKYLEYRDSKSTIQFKIKLKKLLDSLLEVDLYFTEQLVPNALKLASYKSF